MEKKEYLIEEINSKVRYYDLAGKDKPIIFIHGLGCLSTEDYTLLSQENYLSKHRRIVIDLLGSGISDRPVKFNYTIKDHVKYLKEFIEYLDLKNLIIYGHSMGGSISISLASQIPDRTSNLIISEANLDSGGGFFSKKIALFNEKDYVKFGHFEMILESRNDKNFNWANGLENTLAVAINREAKSLVKGENPSWRQKFYLLNTKKTFIFGENSLPDPDFAELTRNNINVEVVKNSGHSMAWENPKGLAETIKNSIIK